MIKANTQSEMSSCNDQETYRNYQKKKLLRTSKVFFGQVLLNGKAQMSTYAIRNKKYTAELPFR